LLMVTMDRSPMPPREVGRWVRRAASRCSPWRRPGRWPCDVVHLAESACHEVVGGAGSGQQQVGPNGAARIAHLGAPRRRGAASQRCRAHCAPRSLPAWPARSRHT
jgi:hypothetical protein